MGLPSLVVSLTRLLFTSLFPVFIHFVIVILILLLVHLRSRHRLPPPVLLVVVDALQPALLHFPLLISSRPGFCFPLAFMHRCTADLLARDYPTPSQQHLTWVAPAAGFALTFLSHAYAFDACFPFLSSLSSTSAFVPCRAVVCRRLKSSELAF